MAHFFIFEQSNLRQHFNNGHFTAVRSSDGGKARPVALALMITTDLGYFSFRMALRYLTTFQHFWMPFIYILMIKSTFSVESAEKLNWL